MLVLHFFYSYEHIFRLAKKPQQLFFQRFCLLYLLSIFSVLIKLSVFLSFFYIQQFPRIFFFFQIFNVHVSQSPGISGSRFFKVHVFQDPSFLGSWLSKVWFQALESIWRHLSAICIKTNHFAKVLLSVYIGL